MIELQHVFSQFAPAFLKTHPVRTEGRKAIHAIRSCRTAALGGHVDQCDACHDVKVSYNSCRNRHCPKCGQLKKEQWILDRTAELLPVPYFHTVFTVPHELNPLFLAHPRVMYALLFKAASTTLTKLARDPQFLGAQIGVTMVLHTWGQNLSFHPHVHCIVPGGGLSPSGCSFVRSRKKFFIPVKVLSALFRGTFLFLLKQAWSDQSLSFSEAGKSSFSVPPLLPALYEKEWVVYCKKPFKSPYHMVQYLSRYTHKTAISNSRIIAMNEDSVSFRYRDYKDNSKVKLMTLTGVEFIRRFMLHVLPSRFQRIRYYGFLSNGHRTKKLQICYRLNRMPIKAKVKSTAKELLITLTGVDLSLCPSCGGHWQQISTLHPGSG